MQKKHHKDVKVIAFPCNQFGRQEPGVALLRSQEALTPFLRVMLLVDLLLGKSTAWFASVLQVSTCVGLRVLQQSKATSLTIVCPTLACKISVKCVLAKSFSDADLPAIYQCDGMSCFGDCTKASSFAN
eukprot:1208060-Amphidinium_carterae.1